MKKTLKLFWQLLLFPLLYVPYRILNEQVIVKWLGCGCPRLDENGNMITNRFNANSFTLLFWGLIALAVVIVSVFNSAKIQKWYFKAIYITLISMASIVLALLFFYSMQWR